LEDLGRGPGKAVVRRGVKDAPAGCLDRRDDGVRLGNRHGTSGSALGWKGWEGALAW
jgi:hypothetical protein